MCAPMFCGLRKPIEWNLLSLEQRILAISTYLCKIRQFTYHFTHLIQSHLKQKYLQIGTILTMALAAHWRTICYCLPASTCSATSSFAPVLQKLPGATGLSFSTGTSHPPLSCQHSAHADISLHSHCWTVWDAWYCDAALFGGSVCNSNPMDNDDLLMSMMSMMKWHLSRSGCCSAPYRFRRNTSPSFPTLS